MCLAENSNEAVALNRCIHFFLNVLVNNSNDGQVFLIIRLGLILTMKASVAERIYPLHIIKRFNEFRGISY